jgi:hypothetical protein
MVTDVTDLPDPGGSAILELEVGPPDLQPPIRPDPLNPSNP